VRRVVEPDEVAAHDAAAPQSRKHTDIASRVSRSIPQAQRRATNDARAPQA
jgi:hypothetical protein